MANGWLKSSAMQDKIIGRVDGHRWEPEAPKENKRAWTPERWSHRTRTVPAASADKVDLTVAAEELRNRPS